MNYRAACPHCGSIFRLGDDQLAAAKGWVQCGVCGAAFDARLSLLMEDGTSLPVANAPEPTSTPVESVPETPANAAPPLHTETEVIAVPEPAPAEQAPAPVEPEAPAAESAPPEQDTPQSAEMPRGIREREDALDLPSIILIDPNLPTYDEPGPMPVIKVEPAQATEAAPQDATPATTGASLPSPVSAPPIQPAARIEYAHPQPGTARAPIGPRRVKPWIWWTGSVLLLLALAAQIAYFLRDSLSSQLPQTRPLYEQACALLGCTLSLPRDLDQLQIVGSDLQTEAGGRLRLVLTLGNRADHAQAWPVLVLTLTDQAGRPLARRSFAPSEYLDNADRIAAGMPPRSEQPLSLPLSVRDIAPMGFDLRLTY